MREHILTNRCVEERKLFYYNEAGYYVVERYKSNRTGKYKLVSSQRFDYFHDALNYVNYGATPIRRELNETIK